MNNATNVGRCVFFNSLGYGLCRILVLLAFYIHFWLLFCEEDRSTARWHQANPAKIIVACATICGPTPQSAGLRSKQGKCRAGSVGRTIALEPPRSKRFHNCRRTRKSTHLRRRPHCSRSTPATGCIVDNPCRDSPLCPRAQRKRPIELEARQSLSARGRCTQSRHCGTTSSLPPSHPAATKRSSAHQSLGEMVM